MPRPPKKYVYFDIETNGIDYTRLHCVVFRTEDGKETVWTSVDSLSDLVGILKDFLESGYTLVGHNILGFDIPALEYFTKFEIDRSKCVDTFVQSRLIDYKKYNTHSLREIGDRLGVYKGEFTGPWDELSVEMLEYCKQDVIVTEAIHKDNLGRHLPEAYKTEHDTAVFAEELSSNGFPYDIKEATKMLEEIKADMAELETKFDFHLPDKELKRLKIRKKANGDLYTSVIKAMYEYPKDFTIEGDELVVWTRKEFNPRSSKDRVTALNMAGWNPVEKTKGHLDLERVTNRHLRRGGRLTNKEKEKLENYSVYGWKVNETNLSTLPITANDAARSLAEWLTLEGRRSSLEECINRYNPHTGCIHASFWHIGAWTHRMSHSGPNMANIASPFHGTPETAVENVKAKYDTRLRALWSIPDGRDDLALVGCDASSVQLRVLAHYLDDPDFTKSVVEGKQEDGTDVHTRNMHRLAPYCKDRDTAKTFIYAFLLGAGAERVSIILGCTKAQATKAINAFISSIPALKYLKETTIPRIAYDGYFLGFDGRRVKVSSEHLVLAGMLQAGEKVIMSRATSIWKKNLDSCGILHIPVNFVHDEWQTITTDHHKDLVGSTQVQALRDAGYELSLNCPIDGEYKTGRNWSETH